MPRAPRQRATTVLWEGRRRITVETLPGRGLYVRHLANPEGVDAVHRPTVGWAGGPSRGGAFTTAWLRARLPQTDVVHVVGLRPGQHPDDVRAAIDLTRASGTPLVVTGYNLGAPHSAEAARLGEQLDLLVPAADAVLTLTDTAAAEMRRRWDVEAVVLPHPHVVNFVRMRQERPVPPPAGRGRLRVGTHLGSLRGGPEQLELVTALAEAVARTPRADLVVHAHRTVQDVGTLHFATERLRALQDVVRSAGGRLVLHDRLSDDQLWDHLASLDVSVVPDRLAGSHSIWPEACADLGTWAVLAQDSFAAAQRPCLTYRRDAGPAARADDLAAALATAASTPAPRSDTEERWSERVRIAESLRSTYEEILGIAGKRRLRYTA